MIPPLCIVAFAEGTYPNSNVRTIHHLGVPLKGFVFAGLGETEDRFSHIRSVRFNPEALTIQPQFLLDEQFVKYMKTKRYMVSVEVWGSTVSPLEISKKEIPDDNRFFYVGAGIFQVLIPGQGFQFSWPKSFSWKTELSDIEGILISRYPDGMCMSHPRRVDTPSKEGETS